MRRYTATIRPPRFLAHELLRRAQEAVFALESEPLDHACSGRDNVPGEEQCLTRS
jgi:hypothetical protein